jgi:hypothetical protein
MTDNITLRRAVVEQVREALVVAWQSTPVWQIAEARNALVAALAEPDAICSAKDNEAALERVANRVKPGQVKGLLPEPDATREPVHPGYLIGSHWLETAYSRIAAGEAEADVLAEVLGARGWAKRKPATMKQIITAHGTTIGAPWFEEFARTWKAAERFHGIRKEDK